MTCSSSVLLTDFYELTMIQAYLDQDMTDTAVFEFFVRKLPPHRGFLMAAGLEQVVEFLETLHFTEGEVAWLASTGRFQRSFLEYAAGLRFTGDVDAMPEGTIFFPHEPILRVTAPLPLAQLVETRIMNVLNFQSMIASKAARSVLVAQHKPLIDFGLRRAHGAEAGLLAARASYLAGFSGTATVLAGQRFGIPIYGTMAHSYVQAHRDEAEAFAHFAQAHPEHAVLLIDTYDTVAAARKVVELARALRHRGISVQGVRLDSGDLGEHARLVRRILDEGGLTTAQILASGNLDEYRIFALVNSGAPIDSFAVGTAMTTSSDAPALDCAYKLQEYAGRPCRKRSEGKATWPGRKQVFRRISGDGCLAGDVVTLLDAPSPNGTPLLEPVMREGKRVALPLPLSELRRRAAEQLAAIPIALRHLQDPAAYPVEIAAPLRALAQAVDTST